MGSEEAHTGVRLCICTQHPSSRAEPLISFVTLSPAQASPGRCLWVSPLGVPLPSSDPHLLTDPAEQARPRLGLQDKQQLGGWGLRGRWGRTHSACSSLAANSP